MRTEQLAEDFEHDGVRYFLPVNERLGMYYRRMYTDKGGIRDVVYWECETPSGATEGRYLYPSATQADVVAAFSQKDRFPAGIYHPKA